MKDLNQHNEVTNGMAKPITLKTQKLTINKDGKVRWILTENQLPIGKPGDYFHILADVERQRYIIQYAGSITPPEAFGAEDA